MSYHDPNFTAEIETTHKLGNHLKQGFLRNAENRDLLWINSPYEGQDLWVVFGEFIEILGAALDGDWETVAMLRETYYPNGDRYEDQAVRLAAAGKFATAATPNRDDIARHNVGFINTKNATPELSILLDRIAASKNHTGSYNSSGKESTHDGLIDMSIAEVLSLAEDNQSIRLGRYGFSADTLKKLVDEHPTITEETTFNSSTQDMLGIKLLKDAGIEEFGKGNITPSEVLQKINELVAKLESTNDVVEKEEFDPTRDIDIVGPR